MQDERLIVQTRCELAVVIASAFTGVPIPDVNPIDVILDLSRESPITAVKVLRCADAVADFIIGNRP